MDVDGLRPHAELLRIFDQLDEHRTHVVPRTRLIAALETISGNECLAFALQSMEFTDVERHGFIRMLLFQNGDAQTYTVEPECEGTHTVECDQYAVNARASPTPSAVHLAPPASRPRQESLREALGFPPAPASVETQTVASASIARDIAEAREAEQLNLQKQKPKDMHVFGVSLALSVKRNSKDSCVPTVINLAMDWLNDRLLNVRGAWRPCTNAAVLASMRHYKEALDLGADITFAANEDPQVVTSLVLTFIKDIPEGVINARATAALCAAGDNVSALAVIISALSTVSRHLLAKLFAHLYEMSHQQFMEATELAKCFCHHLGQFQDPKPEDALSPNDLVLPIACMVKHYHEVFGA